MSVEENLRLREAANKALNDHDVNRFLSLHLESVIVRDIRSEPAKGRKALREGVEPMIRAFPDLQLVTERAFGTSVVATVISATGFLLAGWVEKRVRERFS